MDTIPSTLPEAALATADQRATQLVDYIRRMPDFALVERQAMHSHMGATIAEAILATPGDYDLLEDRPDDPALPWRFGITNKLVRRLRAHGWDAAVPGTFGYRFMPTNGGCVLWVTPGSAVEISLSDEPW